MSDKFKYRSEESEWMDSPGVSKAMLFQNLYELDILNRKLGGHAIILQGIKKLLTNKNRTYHIVDLGCGSGDSMKHIADYSRKTGFRVRLTGVDINPDVISYLSDQCRGYNEITGIAADYFEFLKTAAPIDIVLCSLFCHHLNDLELSALFGILKKKVQTGFVMSDLRRNRLVYFGTKIFTRLTNSTPLAKNDGPVSVLRGFKEEELRTLLQRAGIQNFTIARKWAFRFLLVVHNSFQNGTARIL